MGKGIDLLKAGTKIVLTKKRIKRQKKFFMFEIGARRAGIITSDCKLGQFLFFKKCEEIKMTSIVSSVFEEEGALLIETEFSVYSVRIVADDNDEEFRRLVLC